MESLKGPAGQTVGGLCALAPLSSCPVIFGSEATLVPRTPSQSGVQFGTMPGEHWLLHGCEKEGIEDGRDSLPVR